LDEINHALSNKGKVQDHRDFVKIIIRHENLLKAFLSLLDKPGYSINDNETINSLNAALMSARIAALGMKIHNAPGTTHTADLLRSIPVKQQEAFIKFFQSFGVTGIYIDAWISLEHVLNLVNGRDSNCVRTGITNGETLDIVRKDYIVVSDGFAYRLLAEKQVVELADFGQASGGEVQTREYPAHAFIFTNGRSGFLLSEDFTDDISIIVPEMNEAGFAVVALSGILPSGKEAALVIAAKAEEFEALVVRALTAAQAVGFHAKQMVFYRQGSFVKQNVETTPVFDLKGRILSEVKVIIPAMGGDNYDFQFKLATGELSRINTRSIHAYVKDTAAGYAVWDMYPARYETFLLNVGEYPGDQDYQKDAFIHFDAARRAVVVTSGSKKPLKSDLGLLKEAVNI
jgi:hypothetical protein